MVLSDSLIIKIIKLKFIFIFALSTFSCTPSKNIVNHPIVIKDDGNGVSIQVAEYKNKQSLKFTFIPSPDKEPVHLYDCNLPISGLGGVGRPTLVEIKPGENLIKTGEVYALEKLLTSDDDLKHYPPGPVNIIMGCKLKKETMLDKVPVTFLFTYMACAENFCHPPVTRKEVKLVLPVSWLQ